MMNQMTRWDPFENLLKDFRGLVLQPVDLSASNPDERLLFGLENFAPGAR